MSEEPPFLPVGTEISAKFKGAFCEAKVKKVVKNVKCKVIIDWELHGEIVQKEEVCFKDVQGGTAVLDESAVKGAIRVGALVNVTHPETKQLVSAVVQHLKDCSTYTVVFDDGDEKVLRRTQMCLKGGKHFHASESLDVMPLTKPEQFGAPVLGRRKGGRRKKVVCTTAADNASDSTSSSDDDDMAAGSVTRSSDLDEIGSGVESESKRIRLQLSPYVGGSQSADYGRVVCVYESLTDSRRWFPALIVSPEMKKNVKVNTKEEYLVKSFKDGRCIAVEKMRVKDFNLSKGKKVDLLSIKLAVEKAILYLEKDELPSQWDRELLFGEKATAENDAAVIEQPSSPGSLFSLADISASPRSALNEDQLLTSGKRAREGTSKVSNRRDQSDSSDSDESDEKSDESDSDDGRSPEVSGRGKGKSAEKHLRRSRHTSDLSQRSTTPKNRAQQHHQTRRKAGTAAASSEKKDRFVAQLYKFMEERGTPINKAPVLAGKELDLYQFYDTVKKLGGYNRVCHKSEWKTVIKKMKLTGATAATIKNAYNRYLFNFDSFYRKLGCALADVSTPGSAGRANRRERHASKTGLKPPTASESTPEPSRRQATITKTLPASKEPLVKPQKASSGAAVVGKSVSTDAVTGRSSPKAIPSSREASKERSPSSPPAPPHPPITDEELVVGARVKVHYGSGSHRKLYQAKIVKIESDNRYVVHYLGWNTRYDEAVSKSRIVEVLSAITAASSDSGVSNNDQSENGNSIGGQKMPRSSSRTHLTEKPPFWRRRRSSGGSTHSLPNATPANEQGASRKTSSISATQWRKTESATAKAEEGDESGREGYKAKQPAGQALSIEVIPSGTPVKRPASANPSSESRDKSGESTQAAEAGPPRKRGRKAANSGSSTTSINKRKRSLDESEGEEETKSNAGGSRRVSKRLRGVKASIEEELLKQQVANESDNEEEKSDATSATMDTTIVKVELEETTLTLAAPSTTTELVEIVRTDTAVQPVATSSPRESEETMEEKDVSSDEGKAVDGQAKSEPEEQETKCDDAPEEPDSTRDVETKDNSTASVQLSTLTGHGGPQKARTGKMRRRRRNYSQMVTDHRSRSTANKAYKKDADSDGETGGTNGAGASGIKHDCSPRDPNSLQALRHRIQAEMEADPSKFKSNYSFNIIDESLDSERKIQVMQTHIAELKDAYLKIRAELSGWEKCRKKLLEKKRKQERHAIKASKRASITTSTDGTKKGSTDTAPSSSKDAETKSIVETKEAEN